MLFGFLVLSLFSIEFIWPKEDHRLVAFFAIVVCRLLFG
jgi:hypothetical protein